MLSVMLVAHLLGDYLFQPNALACWKARSLMGVWTHGIIVTLTTVACAMLVDVTWWPYALAIGVVHTLLDVVRARLVHPKNAGEELAWYLLDQALHLCVISIVVASSGTLARRDLSDFARWLTDPRLLAHIIGYLLLLNPAWVLLRFTVRGVWGPDAAPHLGAGEKYAPMVERVLIASCVLLGQAHLAPLILLPRRLAPLRVQGMGVGVLVRSTTHWAETAMSVGLALIVGLILRVM
jgi:hypothetical protein